MLGRDLPTRVLLYHCVGSPIQNTGMMITPLEVLEAQIAWLVGLGYRFLTAGQLAAVWRGSKPPPGIAVLTFDDGWRDGLTTVAPYLNRLGLRATFFICPGGFGNRQPRLGDAGVIMTEAEAHALHDAGMELASHTMTHRHVLKLSDAELRQEFVESRQAVEAITSARCLTLAYPTGRHDPRVERAAADAGYRLAFTYGSGPWRRFAVPRWAPGIDAGPERVAGRLELSAELAGHGEGAAAPPLR